MFCSCKVAAAMKGRDPLAQRNGFPHWAAASGWGDVADENPQKFDFPSFGQNPLNMMESSTEKYFVQPQRSTK